MKFEIFDKLCQYIIIGLLIVILVIFISGLLGGSPNPEAERLQRANDSLQVETLKRDSLIQVSALKVKQLHKKDSILMVDNQKLKARIASLESARGTIIGQVANMVSDTVYARLQSDYPTTDTLLLYKFSSEQIKSIYITKLQNANLLKSDSAFRGLVKIMDEQLTTKDKVISQKDLQITEYQEKVKYNEAIIVNKDQLYKYLELELAREKRAKRLWQLGALAGGVIVVLVAL